MNYELENSCGGQMEVLPGFTWRDWEYASSHTSLRENQISDHDKKFRKYILVYSQGVPLFTTERYKIYIS
jgi:hypothetical protein